MRCRVLGNVRIETGSAIKAVRGQQAVVLAHLVDAHPGSASVDRLSNALWGDEPPSTARTGLQVAITKLRRRLGSGSVDFDGHAYRLDLPSAEVDALAFVDAVDEAERCARRGDCEDAITILDEAFSWWSGPPFGSTTVPSLPSFQHLHDTRARADDLYVELLLDVDETERALAAAEAACAFEPLRERRWCLLITALYRSGRAPDALRAAERYRRILANETGLEAGPAIRALESAVLEHDPALLGNADRDGAHRTRALVIAAPRGAPPAVTTTFIGRSSQRAQLVDAVSRNRLVTVTGPGGIGKTRLVIEVCASTTDRRVIWVDLSVETGATVAAAVAEHLGVRVGSEAIFPGELFALEEPTLAVLDNAEHCLSEVGAVAEAILAASPRLHIIVTSRSPLTSPGGATLRLDPLGRDDAVALLNDRTDMGRALPSAEARALVDRLDCLPLAIELLASRLRTMTVGELLAESSQTERTLPTGVVEGISARVTTSVDALGDAERRLFRSLSVMAGPFTSDDASGVSGCPPGEIRPLLDALVLCSLVAVDLSGCEPRYRLLETFRGHGLDLARAEGSLAAHRSAHAAHFVGRAVWHGARIRTRDEATAARSLDAMTDQLREAWAWCRADADLDRAAALAESTWEWSLSGLRDRQYAWAPDLAEDTALDDHPRRWDVLAVAALAEWARDRRLEACRLGEAALTGAVRVGQRTPAFAHQALFNAYAYEGRNEVALRHLLAGLARAEEDGVEFLQVGSHVTLSLGYSQFGAVDEAEKSARRALAIADAIGNTSCRAFALHALGSAGLTAEPGEAVALLTEAVDLAASVGNRWIQGVALAGLATAQRRTGDLEQAAGILASLLPHWFRVAMTAQLGHSLHEAALVLDGLGYQAAARRALAHVPWTGHLHPQLPDDAAAVKAIARELGVEPVAEPDLAEVVSDLVSALAAAGQAP